MSVKTLVDIYEPIIQHRNNRKKFWRDISERGREIYASATLDGRDCPTYVAGLKIAFDELHMVMYCFEAEIREEIRRALAEAKIVLTAGDSTKEETEVWKDIVDHNALVRRIGKTLTTLLKKRLNVHDLSKLDSTEFPVFAEYVPKLKGSTYGSEEYKDHLKNMGDGLKMHYRRNKHHPEHFGEGILDMDIIDLLEMICDWAAAVHKHENGDLVKSIDINTERFQLGHQLRSILHNSVQILKYPS